MTHFFLIMSHVFYSRVFGPTWRRPSATSTWPWRSQGQRVTHSPNSKIGSLILSAARVPSSWASRTSQTLQALPKSRCRLMTSPTWVTSPAWTTAQWRVTEPETTSTTATTSTSATTTWMRPLSAPRASLSLIH